MTDTQGMTAPAAWPEVREYDTVLSAEDRCDRCGAQAYVIVISLASNEPLRFCAHHYGKGEDGLLKIATHVLDHRKALTRLEQSNPAL